MTVTLTQEKGVDRREIKPVGETHVSFAGQAAVDVADQIAGIALRVDKNYFSVWVIDQQSDQLSCGISRTTDYADIHFSLSFRLRFCTL